MEPNEFPEFPPFEGIDALYAEQREQAVLLNEGITFNTPKKSLLRFFGPKVRIWRLHQLYLGTLDLMSKEMLELDLSTLIAQKNQEAEAWRLTTTHSMPCARIIAMALLNNSWGIRFLTKPLALYLHRRLPTAHLLHLVGFVNELANLDSFIASIRLLSLKKRRTTTPVLMEDPEAGKAQNRSTDSGGLSALSIIGVGATCIGAFLGLS